MLVICLVGLITATYIFSQSRLGDLPDCDDGNCGKLVGNIIDAETKDNVNENFYIAFTDCAIKDKQKIINGEHIFYFVRSDTNGKFSAMIPEGRYCLQFWPVNPGSNYCMDPVPALNDSYSQTVYVKRGKISTIQKLAKVGGHLKILLVDTNNNKINPIELLWKKFYINVKITSEKVSPNILRIGSQTDLLGLNDGEFIIKNLPPEFYNVNIEFENMGYGSQSSGGIEIIRNSITEVPITVDLNNQTGIEGKITDMDNNPLKGVHVTAKSANDKELLFISDFGDIYTDSEGRYRIIGLKEQKYDLFIYGKKDGVACERNRNGIEIKHGVILKMNFKLDFSK